MTGVIIQARMGSERLPGKVMLPIGGRPMLGHVVERVLAIPRIERIVIAATQSPRDAHIQRWAWTQGIAVYRGRGIPHRDVLTRFYRCARQFGIDPIVRITSDCPLLDPGIAARVIEMFRSNPGVAYVSNVHPRTFPDGLDVEVFSAAALKKAYFASSTPEEREHVTPYIWQHPDEFKCMNLENDTDLSAVRWTVDTALDLEMVRGLMRQIPAGVYSMQAIPRRKRWAIV